MATAVFFHAHPDDEAIATGGTMARMAADGHRVVLVTATRGELGEVPDGFLAPGETLADRRALELDAACAVLGVARHEFLGYGDSGMAGQEYQRAIPGASGRPTSRRRRNAWRRSCGPRSADVLTAYDEHGELRPPRPHPGPPGGTAGR